MFSNFFEYLSFYEIMWKNIVQPGWPRMTTQRMCIECWIQKATNTNHNNSYLFFHRKNGCTKASRCYVTRTVPILLKHKIYRVYQNDWSVWKLIIFTSMVNGLINTSRNERVTLLVYDTCLQMFDVCTLCHTAHIKAIVQFLSYSDQQVRCDGLHSHQRHLVV
jgi:hypothetical protein